MNLLSVVGARPQFIKAGPVSDALRAAGLHEVIVHEGQHYDRDMSKHFFEEPEIPEPGDTPAVLELALQAWESGATPAVRVPVEGVAFTAGWSHIENGGPDA